MFAEGEITGGETYYLLIALGVAVGAVFEDYVYRSCFKQLLQSLQNRYFTAWSLEQSLSLVWFSSLLLPDILNQENYRQTLNLFFRQQTVESGLEAVLFCTLEFNKIIHP